MNSITIDWSRSEKLTSYTRMMLGWFSTAIAFDSFLNRRRMSALSIYSSRRILTATIRSSMVSYALKTFAIPPMPMISMISYLPSSFLPRYLSI